MRCLIVEADNSFALRIGRTLGVKKIAWEVVSSTAGAGHLLEEVGYHMMLVGMDRGPSRSIEFVRHARSERPKLPIVMVSGEVRPDLRVAAFEAGADDCVTSCIDPEELVARLHNLVRRAHAQSSPVIEVGEVTVHMNAKVAQVAGTPLDLTRIEYRTLELLALRSGQAISKSELVQHLYGVNDGRDARIIDVYICKLRRKLEEILADGRLYIRTIRSEGFVLEAPGSSPAAPLCRAA